MKHTRSTAEVEIRVAVVDRLRNMFPTARIIHELNTASYGSRRIDVAAVTNQSLIGVEIKSAKDTLKRLDEQFTAFNKCFHFVFVAAHEKHFIEYRNPRSRADVPPETFLNHALFFDKWSAMKHVWRFPNGLDLEKWRSFDFYRDAQTQPRALDMLEMLWASELRDECIRHNIKVSSKSNRPTMIKDMVWLMTGREIVEAVCRQLRQREFTEADAPIVTNNQNTKVV